MWERPKALEYRLPWTERLATIGRRRPPLRPATLAPRVLAAVTIPFRPGVAAREAAIGSRQAAGNGPSAPVLGVRADGSTS